MLSPAAFANDADPLTSNSCHVGWGTIESTTDDTGDTVVVVRTSVSEKVGAAEGNGEGIIISDEGRVVGIGCMVRGVAFGGEVMIGTIVGVLVVVLEGMEVGNDDGGRTIADGSSDGVDDSTDS